MRSKSILVTIYYEQEVKGQRLLLDENNGTEEWDYEISLNRLLQDHLKEVNVNGVRIIDVAIDTDRERIHEVLSKKEL
jgi:uncharacterized protein YjbK